MPYNAAHITYDVNGSYPRKKLTKNFVSNNTFRADGSCEGKSNYDYAAVVSLYVFG